MKFYPTTCPQPACPSKSDGSFQYQRKGHYRRKCDGRLIPRFLCVNCGKQFSSQTFRFTYRYRRPNLRLQLFHLLTAKVTMRQSARILNCSRDTVDRLHRKMGRICKEYHQIVLDRNRGKINGIFQLDELETFETDRLTRPVTVPVLIERKSYFVLHTEAAAMGPRGNIHPAAQKRKDTDEIRFGKRKSESREAVQRSLKLLREMLPKDKTLHLQTDRKTTYRSLARQIFPECIGSHVRESSRRRRDYRNVLFPINHTLAMMRDGISRLVRRSWGASKQRERLSDHLAIWVTYRNYVRGITVIAPRTTPGMALGLQTKPTDAREILAWRWPKRMPQCPAKQARF